MPDRFPHEPDFCDVWPGTAIRAAGHPDADGFFHKTIPVKGIIYFSDQGGQIPFRFSESQRACIQCYAGQGLEPET